MSDVDAANQLIDAWLAYRDMAAQVLVTSLNLESPKDVLRPAFRGRHELKGTGWCYRTHGIGVDMATTSPPMHETQSTGRAIQAQERERPNEGTFDRRS